MPWLWNGRIPAAAVSLLEGDKGEGKSSILASLAASLTAGKRVPGRSSRKKGDVLWLAGEEDVSRVLRPKLEAAGCDLERVRIVTPSPRSRRSTVVQLPLHLRALEDEVQLKRPALIVIDPLQSFIGPAINLNSDQDARAVLEPLRQLAEAYQVAVVLTRNLTKARGCKAIDQGLGSVAIGAVARSILRVGRMPSNPHQRVLSVVVCNLVHATPALRYELVDAGDVGRVKWGKEVDMDTEDMNDQHTDAGTRDALADAQALLRRALVDGWVPVKELVKEATAAAISEMTLRRAKAALGVRSRRQKYSAEGFWEWGPPEHGWAKE